MKAKYIALALAVMFAASSVMAQKKGGKNAAQPYNGGITTEMMQQMKQCYSGNAADKALRNILVTNSPPTAWRARPSPTRSLPAAAGCLPE